MKLEGKDEIGNYGINKNNMPKIGVESRIEKEEKGASIW